MVRKVARDSAGLLLALDTSTALASVALYDGSVSAELTWRSGRNHSVELMEQVAALMRLRRSDFSQVVAIAVATGPGSYTGLRVGLAAGKGLCLALGVPMVGVCTLDVLAEAHRDSCLPVRPLLDAGRHRFATALYGWERGEFRRLGPIEGGRLPQLLKAITERTLLCGDVSEKDIADELEEKRLAQVAAPAASLRRAGYLAEIGWRRFMRGDMQEAAQVDALYLSREEA